MVVDALMLALAHRKTNAPHFSLNDFGAGVGQYRGALYAADPRYRYRRYDGAGNVGEVTDHFIRFFDLTMPLAFPRADWVLFLEVGEHVPNNAEAMVIRNVHAHNCRGIVMSWGTVGQGGHGHVNCHTASYLIAVFTDLGYYVDQHLTTIAKHGVPSRNYLHVFKWFRSNVFVLRHFKPLTGPGCTSA